MSNLNNENEPHLSIDHDIDASDREMGEVIEIRNSRISEHTEEPSSERNQEPQHDMILIHDSICKNIDLKRLSDRTDFNGLNIPASDLRQAENVIDEMENVKVIILHVGVNNLRSKSVEEKADRVILSLIIPCRQ